MPESLPFRHAWGWHASALPFGTYLFLGSWVVQFIGHGVFERRAPALLDNLGQGRLGSFLLLLSTVMTCETDTGQHWSSRRSLSFWKVCSALAVSLTPSITGTMVRPESYADDNRQAGLATKSQQPRLAEDRRHEPSCQAQGIAAVASRPGTLRVGVLSHGRRYARRVQIVIKSNCVQIMRCNIIPSIPWRV